MCFVSFFGAKIWPAAAGTGELARDLRDQTPTSTHNLPVAVLCRFPEARGPGAGDGTVDIRVKTVK